MTSTPPRSSIWDTVRAQGVARSSADQWFGGVCSGLARHFGVDPMLMRAAVIALVLLGGFGVAAYAIAWLMLPDESGRIILEGLVGEGDTSAATAIAVLVAAAIGAVVLLNGDNTFFSGGFVPLVLVGGAIFWRRRRRQGTAWRGPRVTTPPPPNGFATPSAGRQPPAAAPTEGVGAAAPAPEPHPPGTAGDQSDDGRHEWQPPAAVGADPARTGSPPPPPPPPPPPALGVWQTHPVPAVMVAPRPRRPRVTQAVLALLVGAALVGYGLGHVLGQPTGFPESGHALGMMIALGVMGLGTVALGMWGRRSAIASLLTLGLALGVSTVPLAAQAGELERGTRVTWTPTTAEGSYELGGGGAVLDLRQVPVGSGTIKASLGAGSLVILVPEDAPVEVRSSVGIGSAAFVAADGTRTEDGGLGPNTKRVIGEPVRVVVDAEIGLGSIEIKEQR